MTNQYEHNISGWKPQPPDYRDYPFHIHLPHLVAAAIPAQASVKALLPPVLDQGPIGSCTAFGSLAAHQGIARKQGISYPQGARLAQYYWSRALEGWQGQDSGAYVRDAVKVLAQTGMAQEPLWPYNTAAIFQAPSSAVVQDASQRNALKYVSVPNDGYSIKAAIAGGLPVIVGFSVPQNFMSAQVAQTGMVPMPSGPIVGGHCVCVCGYDDATGLLEFQNSWGTGWGMQGFGKMPYQFLQQLGADFWVLSEVEGAVVPPPPPPPVRTYEQGYADAKAAAVNAVMHI